ncbi:hypothetical protein [Rufibacter ruber]|uniref:hypothetical protein n=1 Tax=Rufibacter ruber TaxID=1783499 RepID=UPI000830A935|nr:hypothetical protein [Rufibacter ruber]
MKATVSAVFLLPQLFGICNPELGDSADLQSADFFRESEGWGVQIPEAGASGLQIRKSRGEKQSKKRRAKIQKSRVMKIGKAHVFRPPSKGDGMRLLFGICNPKLESSADF